MIQIRMILKLVLILGLMLLLGWRIHWRREKPQTSFSFSCAIIMSIHCDSYHHHHQHKRVSQCDCTWNDQSRKSRTLCFALTNADKELRALLIRKCQDRGRDRIMIECMWERDNFLGCITPSSSYLRVINACDIGYFTSVANNWFFLELKKSYFFTVFYDLHQGSHNGH